MTPRQLLQEIAYQGRVLLRRLRPWTRQESLEHLYRTVNDLLMELEVDYWISFGTLLGYHREGRILAHDRDVDFSVLVEDFEKVKALADLLPEGLSFYDNSHIHGGPKLHVEYRCWKADIYFYERRGEALHLFLRRPSEAEAKPLPVDDILPLREVQFMGRPCRVPARVEEHLLASYGYIGPDAVQDRRTGYWRPRVPLGR